MGGAETILTAMLTGLVTVSVHALLIHTMIGLCTGRPFRARLRSLSAFVFGSMPGDLTLANMAAMLTRVLALSNSFIERVGGIVLLRDRDGLAS